MSELKKMTKKELMPHLEALGLKVDEDSILQFKDGEYLYIKYPGGISLNQLGIELVPEKPKVNQENLCKFYLLFNSKKSRYPFGDFFNPCEENPTKNTSKKEAPLYFILHGGARYLDHDGNFWYDFQVTDPRWPCIDDDHENCEHCNGVR